MRFLQHEHKDLEATLRAAGFTSEDFQTSKRHGKLIVTHRSGGTPFKFFRKKVTGLNSAGRWEDRMEYKVFLSAKGTEVDGWEGVLQQFRVWLNAIQAGNEMGGGAPK